MPFSIPINGKLDIDLERDGYTAYFIDSRYWWDYGIVMATPAAPDGALSEPLKARAVRCRRRVHWMCERADKAPICPHWTPINENEVLLKRKIYPLSLYPEMGGHVWQVRGVYIYGLRQPPTDEDQLIMGAIPADVFTGSESLYLPMSVFKTGIITPG